MIDTLNREFPPQTESPSQSNMHKPNIMEKQVCGAINAIAEFLTSREQAGRVEYSKTESVEPDSPSADRLRC